MSNDLPEPLRDTLDFSATDGLLRDDVRTLGALVGEILAEQCGQPFLDEVETLRRLAIRRREQDEPVDALADRLAGVPPGCRHLPFRRLTGKLCIIEEHRPHTQAGRDVV